MMSATPGTSWVGLLAGRVRAVSQRVLAAALHVLLDDTGGIDDTALPSGFAAPYQRGSRAVRNLWHIPF
jgi:hypothetical protein